MEEAHLLSQGSQLGDSTRRFYSRSIGENLAKHPPLIAKEVGCTALARWPHTEPQIITVEEEGNRFWWTDSRLLHHIEDMNTNRKQRGMWSFDLKWGRGSISKEIFASAFFESFNVSRGDYDRLGASNEVSWLICCLILSGGGLCAAHLTSQLTSYNSGKIAFLSILFFTSDIFTPLSSTLTTIEMLPKCGCPAPTGL